MSLCARLKRVPVAIWGAIIGGVFVLVAAAVPLIIQQCSLGPRKTGVKITRLLPNPVGDEHEDEEATIRNFGSEPVSLVGWKLRDLKGKTWNLDELGVLQQTGKPGDQKTIRRKGQSMGMNDTGDTIELVDPQDNVIDKVSYSVVKKGKEVMFP